MFKSLISKLKNVKNKTIDFLKNLNWFKNSKHEKNDFLIIKVNYGSNIVFNIQENYQLNLNKIDKELLINKSVIICATIKDSNLKYTRGISISKKSTVIKNQEDYKKFINKAKIEISEFYNNMLEDYDDIEIIEIIFKVINIKNE